MNECAKTEPAISIVIPVYCEELELSKTIQKISDVMEGLLAYEIVVVDDGSRDDTWNKIREESEKHHNIRALRLSRNFGKENALCCGLEAAKGKAVIAMDGDLQHPPEIIPKMISLWQDEGFSIVEAVKRKRAPEPFINKAGARLYYLLLGKLTGADFRGASDFKLLDRKVLDAWMRMGETMTYFKGMVVWLGFKRTQITIDSPERTSSKGKWTPASLMRLAINGITSYSSMPLRLVSLSGFIFFVCALVLGVQTLLMKMFGKAVDGFTTVILLILIVGFIIMFSLGIIGEYVANIFEEVKKRPRFVVTERIDR